MTEWSSAPAVRNPNMIFVFADDQTLAILDNIDDVQRECEGIDVEENVYQFFDENGLRLEPEFIEENKKGTIIGSLGWVESGIFDLKKSHDFNTSTILEALEKTVVLEANKYFDSLDEINEFLTNQGSQ